MKTSNEDKAASEAAFLEEAKPMFAAFFALAEKHDVPFMATAITGYKKTEAGEEYLTTGSFHLNGEDKVPISMAIALQFLKNGMEGGMEMVTQSAMIHLMSDILRDACKDAADEKPTGEPLH